MGDILAGVVDGLNKGSVGIVGDASDHLDRLTLKVVKTGSLNVAVSFDKGSLLRGTGEVAEVLAEVEPAGGTCAGKEGTRQSEAVFQISQLPCAAAKVHLQLGIKIKQTLQKCKTALATQFKKKIVCIFCSKF